jgi:hypothetical protein
VVTPPASQTQLAPIEEKPVDGSVFRGPQQNFICETDSLMTGRVAFVLGRRGRLENSYPASTSVTTGINSQLQQNVPLRQKNALVNFAQGGADVNCIQRMASFGYLERYFFHILRKKVIEIGSNDLFENTPGAAQRLPQVLKKVNSDLTGMSPANVDGEKLLKAIHYRTFPPTENTAVAIAEARAASAAAVDSMYGARVALLKNSGIFMADDGPFLRGKTLERKIAKLGGSSHSAKFVCGSIGDDVAFSSLSQMIANTGAMDWTPDGICHSKLSQGDALLDEELDSRDGSLYNITIGGPAIATSWCGNKYGEVLPLDKMFVVIVADVWDGKAIGEEPWQKENDQGATKGISYNTQKDTANNAPRTAAERKTYLEAADNKALITNMRLRLTTSSEMISFSALKEGKTNQKTGEVDPTSRMGLRLCGNGGVSEYIIGGWCMGTVLDSAASRAGTGGNVMSGTVKRSRADSAPNLNVKVEFWSADRMYRSFMNAHSSVQTRYSARVSETKLRRADVTLRSALTRG